MRKYMKKMLPVFIKGGTETYPSAFCVKGSFYSYKMKIAEYNKKSNTITLCTTRCSNTTSRQQSAIKEFAKANGINLVETFKPFNP